MAKIAYRECCLRQEDLALHDRFFHEADGTITKGKSSGFRERFARAVAERLIADWDKFVHTSTIDDGTDVLAYIYIDEKK